MGVRGIRSARPRAHASLRASETRFRIDQELPGGYDLLAFLKTSDYAGVIGVLFTNSNLNRLESMIGVGHDHEIARPSVNDSFSGHEQGVLVRTASEARVRKHSGPPEPVMIWEFDPDAQGVGVGVGLRQHADDPAREGTIRERGTLHGCSAPDADWRGGLRQSRLDPDGIDALDRRERGARADRHPRANVQGIYRSGDWHEDGEFGLYLPRRLDLRYERERHSQACETLASSGDEWRVAVAEQGKEFRLGGGPLWHQQVHEWRIAAHEVARRVRIDTRHESRRPRLHDRGITAVEHDGSRSPDRLRDFAAFDPRQSNAQILGQSRVDSNARLLAAALVRVSRD